MLWNILLRVDNACLWYRFSYEKCIGYEEEIKTGVLLKIYNPRFCKGKVESGNNHLLSAIQKSQYSETCNFDFRETHLSVHPHFRLHLHLHSASYNFSISMY